MQQDLMRANVVMEYASEDGGTAGPYIKVLPREPTLAYKNMDP